MTLARCFRAWGYPHQNKTDFEQQFPADFISEALDQTRGWFYSQSAISTMLFGENGAESQQRSGYPTHIGIALSWD